LKLQQLAEEAGMSVGFLSDAERGESGLSGEKINSIARVLGTSTDYLLAGENSPPTLGKGVINIPTALSEAAVKLKLTHEQTIRLLEGRKSLVARRSSAEEKDWAVEEWITFYGTVKDYL
jgi:transcriptional regulator with XRE-family HTH domain